MFSRKYFWGAAIFRNLQLAVIFLFAVNTVLHVFLCNVKFFYWRTVNTDFKRVLIGLNAL